MPQILCVVGARPNFIKMAAILDEISRRPQFTAPLVHTGQHFSPEMSQNLFEDLELPKPNYNLGVGAGTQTQQTAEIMKGLETVMTERRPDAVLVAGDVNSTLAAALVAVKLGIRVAHVEAGLRSFDRGMPEETNRLVTDVLSDYLFASEPSGVNNLVAEGIAREKIFFTGNVMIDTLLRFRRKADASDVLTRLGLGKRGYAVVTLHRPSNVDDHTRLSPLLQMLTEVAQRIPIAFPVHPRTRQRIEAGGLTTNGVIFTEPMRYLDFVKLMSEARMVLTDSGGIQEETTILGVPCLTLRENTERPVTIEQGTNRLVGVSPAAIKAAALETLDQPARTTGMPELWDGKAAARILDVLEATL